MALDASKKLPDNVYTHVQGLLREANITPDRVVAKMKTLLANHREYQGQLTKANWEAKPGTYKG